MRPGTPEFDIHGLPRIGSFRDLAAHTGLSGRNLWWMASGRDGLYAMFPVTKKKGGTRLIHRPTTQLLITQRWILRNILDRLQTTPSSFGFERGSKLRRHAEQHVGGRAVMTLDIKNFFPSISIAQVTRVYLVAGYSSRVASILARLCTFRGALPQGAPTSPRLANLVCFRLDQRLRNFAQRMGLVYSRYADDMSFSAPNASLLARCRPFITHIIRDCGFRLNTSKSRLVGPQGRRKVTGLVLTHDSVGIGRWRLRELRARIHHAHLFRGSPDLPAIQGWLDHVSDVDPVRYQMIVRYVDRLRAADGISGLAALRVRPASG
jgi:retron-type reverse transcriptase